MQPKTPIARALSDKLGMPQIEYVAFDDQFTGPLPPADTGLNCPALAPVLSALVGPLAQAMEIDSSLITVCRLYHCDRVALPISLASFCVKLARAGYDPLMVRIGEAYVVCAMDNPVLVSAYVFFAHNPRP